METNNKNKFIVVSYALYDVTKGDNTVKHITNTA